jgi:phospholipid/cholesterol/gamma-HCH transport system ATP-binding protein
MADRKKVVEFNGVSKNLGGKQILEKLTFDVHEGETFVIIGYSGTGKSVTLRHLVGLMQPDEGSIRVDGDEITTMSRKELERMRRKFGVLFQSGALIAWLTLFENVELPLLEHTKMNRKKRAEVVQKKLELVNLWQDRAKFPAEISGGMKKRAGLARAIALDPGIVLYDEPTSGLDPVIANEIGKLIINLRDEHKMTQIVVTHDMQGAYEIADRVAMFYHGKMIQIGAPEEIQSSNMPEVQHFITGGKEGQLSVRSGTAVTRGIAPGMLSARSAQAVAEQPEQEGYVLLSEEEAAATGQADSEQPEETERDLPALEPDTTDTEEPQSLEPEESP